MRRFAWPLQRLLDVTEVRARSLRAELLGLSQEIAAVRGEIFLRRAKIRTALDDFGQLSVRERMAGQETFMRCSQAQRKRLGGLRQELDGLLGKQRAKMDELAKARSSQQTLQRLREEALLRYMSELALAEQKQLDESSQVAFAREQIAERLKRA